MRKTTSGFTIVELLIVIVVIAILATITIVAYNGIQQRARDAARTSDVDTIIKALEAYHTLHNTYPATVPISTNAPTGFSGIYGANYQYSVDTRNNWLATLKTDGIVHAVPVDPANDNSHYYVYWASGANGYGACTEPFYILAVVGYGAGNVPPNSHALKCSDGTVTASWTPTSTMGVFSNMSTPSS